MLSGIQKDHFAEQFHHTVLQVKAYIETEYNSINHHNCMDVQGFQLLIMCMTLQEN